MKKLVSIFLFFVLFSIYSQNLTTLPHPKNSMLYTEFVSYKKATYLKKPIEMVGYIVMNGENNFLFKQTKPILIEVRKNNNKLTFKKESSPPIEIPNSPNGENIAFLFDKNTNYDGFNITKSLKMPKITILLPQKARKG